MKEELKPARKKDDLESLAEPLVKSYGHGEPKGEPGPYGAGTELELVSHIICQLEENERSGCYIAAEDGCNHKKAIDGWALTQALDLLRNYEALLCQPLYKLIPPGFYHLSRPRKTVKGVR